MSKERSGEESTRRRERGEELKLLVSELNTVVSACLQASCTDRSPLQQQLADAKKRQMLRDVTDEIMTVVGLES